MAEAEPRRELSVRSVDGILDNKEAAAAVDGSDDLDRPLQQEVGVCSLAIMPGRGMMQASLLAWLAPYHRRAARLEACHREGRARYAGYDARKLARLGPRQEGLEDSVDE